MRHAVIIQINATGDGFDLDALLEQIEALPGVESATDVALLDTEGRVVIEVQLPPEDTRTHEDAARENPHEFVRGTDTWCMACGFNPAKEQP